MLHQQSGFQNSAMPLFTHSDSLYSYYYSECMGQEAAERLQIDDGDSWCRNALPLHKYNHHLLVSYVSLLLSSCYKFSLSCAPKVYFLTFHSILPLSPNSKPRDSSCQHLSSKNPISIPSSFHSTPRTELLKRAYKYRAKDFGNYYILTSSPSSGTNMLTNTRTSSPFRRSPLVLGRRCFAWSGRWRSIVSCFRHPFRLLHLSVPLAIRRHHFRIWPIRTARRERSCAVIGSKREVATSSCCCFVVSLSSASRLLPFSVLFCFLLVASCC